MFIAHGNIFAAGRRGAVSVVHEQNFHNLIIDAGHHYGVNLTDTLPEHDLRGPAATVLVQERHCRIIAEGETRG
jgi:hypothetical protein